jgi:uncharacterized FAD-dependent dehydrogenase
VGLFVRQQPPKGEVVVNGWSPSRRNNPYANSGIVVEIADSDLLAFGDDRISAGIALQRHYEQRSFALGGGQLRAPAQRVTDLLAGRTSTSLPSTSYNPGVVSVPMSEVFDSALYERLRAGFAEFARRRKGYLVEDAIVVATESRTSSPIRIPRVPATCMHPELPGLYPCGEGAGYAGGIMSAAIDGEKVAEAVAQQLR